MLVWHFLIFAWLITNVKLKICHQAPIRMYVPATPLKRQFSYYTSYVTILGYQLTSDEIVAKSKINKKNVFKVS